MKRAIGTISLVLLLAGMLSLCEAQVALGTPAFSSFGGGTFDAVNLGNLNVHFGIPILHKSGRGMPFVYDLSYDSSIWTPATSAGVTTWKPATAYGWTGLSQFPQAGSTAISSTWTYTAPCDPPDDLHMVTVTFYSGYTYTDLKGTVHGFQIETSSGSQGCSNLQWVPPSSASQLALDGSGLTLFANQNFTPTVYSTSGTTYLPATSSTVTDANGNVLTKNAGGTFIDTLGQTVLTAAGGAPVPLTLTYTSPSGVNAAVTVSFVSKTVQTNFGCTSPGIGEYAATNVPLVDRVTLPDSTYYQFTYETTPGYTSGQVTGRLASVSMPTGGSITYTYNYLDGHNGIICKDGSTDGVTRTLSPGGAWQYIRALVSGSGAGSTWTTTVIDPNSNYTVINSAEDGSSSNPTNNFYETQRQLYQGGISTSDLLKTTIRCYNSNFTNCSTATVSSPISRTDAYSQLPNNSARVTTTLYNNFGLVTDNKEYTYGVTLGAAPSSTYLINETVVNYASLGNHVVGKPASVIMKNGTGTTVASTTYTYDGTTPTATSGTPQHIAITGSRGNLTTLTTSTSLTTSLSKPYSYYDTGTPKTTTDVNGAQTTFVYGTAAQGTSTISCGNSFVTAINEPLTLSRSITWNCVGGIATQTTDENGMSVASTYNDVGFWRPGTISDQENNQTTITYIGQTAVEAGLQSFNGGNSASDFRTTMDGFGRPILTQRLQGPAATKYDTAETDYNILDQPSRSTMPFSSAAGITSATAPSTNTVYDALGRKLTITDPAGGLVSYTYTNNDVLQKTSGTQVFQKQFEYDGLGRLTSVCEMTTLAGSGTCGQGTPVTGYWTTYTYDALGRLLTVTQNAQASGSHQTRVFTYDWMGRMLTESNPETANNGANGTIVYSYDSISPCGDGTNHSYPGDLVQKKDNANNVTCYSYDAFHRVVKAGNGSAANTLLREFVYDSEGSYPTGVNVINGKSHLVEAQTINTSNLAVKITDEYFSYSPRGELTDVYESTPHSSGFYHTTASYWPTGTLETLGGIPGVPMIYYGANNGTGLDGEGRVTEVTAASGINPVTGITYYNSGTAEPLQALTKITFGSADSDSFTYDVNTGRMKTYTFSVNSQTDKGTLTWNTNGTLGKHVIVDQLNATDTQTCNYLYDDLERISSASCGALWSQTFTYDSFGNITKSGSNAFVPGYSATQNQFTSIPGVTVAYDKNGNLLTDNLNTYTWDPNWGNMLTVNIGSAVVTATYDALGRMVENNAGGIYTELIYAPTGKKVATANGQALVKAFIALPGGAKAIYNSSGTLAYYRHSDWLGSSRLTSTASRTIYSSSAYAPFGEQYAPSGTTDASFTGQDQDTASSLYDFPARRYSPSQGRWISPDPLGRGAVTLSNPQSWNRYVYVNNNPLALIDAMGLSVRRHHAMHAMDDAPPDDPIETDDSSDDSGDDGGLDCSNDETACVTATPDPVDTEDSQLNPCTATFGGVNNNSGDPGFAQAAAETNGQVFFPLGGTGPVDLAGNAAASRGLDSKTNVSYFVSVINGLYMAGNTSLALNVFSGSAGIFQQAWDSGNIFPEAMASISHVNFIEPGGLYNAGSDFQGLSAQTFLGTGMSSWAVQGTNDTSPFNFGGAYPAGPVTDINAPHSFLQAWNTPQVQAAMPLGLPCLGSEGGTSKNQIPPIPGDFENEVVEVAWLKDPLSTNNETVGDRKCTNVVQPQQRRVSQSIQAARQQ